MMRPQADKVFKTLYLEQQPGEGLLGVVDLYHVASTNIGEILISNKRMNECMQVMNELMVKGMHVMNECIE